ncbi:MAG: ATP-binding protein [Gammaproteobacteria bacterium]
MMKLLKYILPASMSFRRQLLISVTIGVLLLALMGSLTTSWILGQDAYKNLIDRGISITENFARQSELALIFDEGENAKDSALATLAFPDVEHIAIFNREGKSILTEGSQIPDDLHLGHPDHEDHKLVAHLELETNQLIHIAAPVYAQGSIADESLELNTPATEYLGTVHIGMSKTSLKALQKNILLENLIISFVLATFMVLFLRRLVNRITRPVNDLAEIMFRAEAGEKKVRAKIKGPSEVAHMAEAFNKMISTLEERGNFLRNQKLLLEEEVQERTKELCHARDQAIIASKHKSEFLAIMSHELRTPMNSIIGFTEMAIDELHEIEEYQIAKGLQKVMGATEHLLDMIDNILNLTKIEAGRMDLLIEPVELKYPVDEVASTIQPIIKKNGNELVVEVNDTGGNMMIDEGKLRQILLNLLSNASKFTKNGKITLLANHDGKSLHISVTDTGIGMTEEQCSHIFEEFKQADMSTTRNYGGTGLGLSICQRFCTLMGGAIAVTSKPDEGTCFTVDIPLPVKGSKKEDKEEQDSIAG